MSNIIILQRLGIQKLHDQAICTGKIHRNTSCGTNLDEHRIAGAISENPLPFSGGKPTGRLAKRENGREKYPRLKYRGETASDKLSRVDD